MQLLNTEPTPTALVVLPAIFFVMVFVANAPLAHLFFSSINNQQFIKSNLCVLSVFA